MTLYGTSRLRLEIDGRIVVNTQFGEWDLHEPNPSGIQRLSVPDRGGARSLAIGWPFPLAFRRSLNIRVPISDHGVGGVTVYVVHAREG